MNQIPNIEEEFSRKLMNRLADCAARLASPVDAHTELMGTHHQQLQKARQDWLREEIVRLEAAKYDEPRGYRGKAFNEVMQTIIDRYHSELDQPTL